MLQAVQAAALSPSVQGGVLGHPAALAVDLQVTGLQKGFDDYSSILENISFQVLQRQAVALIGANGSGKSTLLRCCIRLIEPDHGSVRFFGEEIIGASARCLRRLRARVGFVFQRHNLVPRLSALSNVLHGALSLTSATVRRRVI